MTDRDALVLAVLRKAMRSGVVGREPKIIIAKYLYAEGLTIQEISEELSYPAKTLYTHLVQRGVEMRPRMVRNAHAHGASGYRRGCRCDVCREGHTTYQREWKERKRRSFE